MMFHWIHINIRFVTILVIILILLCRSRDDKDSFRCDAFLFMSIPNRTKSKSKLNRIDKKLAKLRSKACVGTSKVYSAATQNIIPRANADNSDFYLFGVDESGRGSIAGPLVVAAVHIPSYDSKSGHTVPFIEGVRDSKQIQNTLERVKLFENINLSYEWVVAIIAPECIDEINILQATLLGMNTASRALVSAALLDEDSTICLQHAQKINSSFLSSKESACSYHQGMFSNKVISTPISYDSNGCMVLKNNRPHVAKILEKSNKQPYGLIDGNIVPSNFPYMAEAIEQGDAKEYCIAAASIIAKVIRDQIMEYYSSVYPKYDFERNKGYSYLKHLQGIRKHGITPIHRRTFVPLKHMTFDDNGLIISETKWRRGRNS